MLLLEFIFTSMNRNSALPMGVYNTSAEYNPDKPDFGLPGKLRNEPYFRTQSLQKLKQTRLRLASTRGKLKALELPELKREFRSGREVSANALSHCRLQTNMKIITSSASLLAKGCTKMLTSKNSRKTKREGTVMTSPCRTMQHKDTRRVDESSRVDSLLPIKHERGSSQILPSVSHEDPYYYANVAALGTSTAFKDILHSRSNNDSQLISSFDRLLKIKRLPILTSLNSFSRFIEHSSMGSQLKVEASNEPESGWASKRAAVLYSRGLDFSPNYKTFMPNLIEHMFHKPNCARLLILVHFEGVIGTFSKRGSQIILQIRFQGIQALKFLQEYFDVVLLLNYETSWSEIICKHLAIKKVKLTAVYSYSQGFKILNYTNIIDSVSMHWRSAVLVAASKMTFDELEDSGLFTIKGHSFELNAVHLPTAEAADKTPAVFIVPHISSEDESEVVSAFVFARVLYDLAYKVSSATDWGRNLEILHSKREQISRNYTNALRVLKSDIIYEVLIELQSSPVTKQEFPIKPAKRPHFYMNYYGILRCEGFKKSQLGLCEYIEVLEANLSDELM